MADAVQLATAGYDHTVRLWDAATGACARTLQYADSHINDLAFSPDNRHIAVAGNPRVVIFDLLSSNPNPYYVLDSHTGNVMGVGFHSDYHWLYSVSDRGELKTWDPRAPGSQKTYANGSPILCAAKHPNDRYVFTGDANGSLRIWDIVAGRVLKSLIKNKHIWRPPPIVTTCVSYDGSLVAACDKDGNLFTWTYDAAVDHGDVSPPVIEYSRAKAHSRYILRVAISPDNSRLATALDSGELKLWNVLDRKFRDGEGSAPQSLQGHRMWVWDALFTRSSKFVLTVSSDKKVLLWDISTGAVVHEYVGHQKAVKRVVATGLIDM